jgi:hypothetical protein
LYGEAASAVTAAGEQTALTTEATGTTAEAAQYQTAGQISAQNAATAEVSGQLQQYQNTRTLMNTLGTQRATYASNGFAQSGSALGVARSSLQQGLLQNQVLGVNSQLEAGGYLEQVAASEAEATAATTTAATETAQAATAGNLASLDKQQEAQSKNFLSQISGVSTQTGANGLPTVIPGSATGANGSNQITTI